MFGMEITPRYDGPPIIELDGDAAAVAVPFERQRRRLESALHRLDDEQWRTPSRCEGWTVRDVISHLTTTNQFWALSIKAGIDGEPTRYLAGFDPKATPAALVEGTRGAAPAETLSAYVESNRRLLSLTGALDAAGWATFAEAPPGHVTISAVAHHALWDSWVHERDIFLPLGLQQDEEPDEILASLRYAAALSPAFGVSNGAEGVGALLLEVTDPAAVISVTVEDGVVRVHDDRRPDGPLVLAGAAVDLLEQLSTRAPLGLDVLPEQAWLISGLAEVFEATA